MRSCYYSSMMSSHSPALNYLSAYSTNWSTLDGSGGSTCIDFIKIFAPEAIQKQNLEINGIEIPEGVARQLQAAIGYGRSLEMLTRSELEAAKNSYVADANVFDDPEDESGTLLGKIFLEPNEAHRKQDKSHYIPDELMMDCTIDEVLAYNSLCLETALSFVDRIKRNRQENSAHSADSSSTH